jgi:putative PIN family toxin of toxin-antitoxin system
VIVFDVSTLFSAAGYRRGKPASALDRALLTDKVAISAPVLAELREVLNRANLARFIDPGARASIIDRLTIHGAFFTPLVAVSDCRDEKDNIYLELALAASAHTIVSSDLDLLVLHPWRGVRILRPAHFLALP